MKKILTNNIIFFYFSKLKITFSKLSIYWKIIKNKSYFDKNANHMIFSLFTIKNLKIFIIYSLFLGLNIFLNIKKFKLNFY
jgi:hypothetical protein